MSAMSNDQASIASGQGPRTPFPADTTFSSVDFEERAKEMRRQVVSQADAFLEWSKEWTSEKSESIGKDLRFLKNESSRRILGDAKADTLRIRIEDMCWAFKVACGDADLSEFSAGTSDAGVMDEDSE